MNIIIYTLVFLGIVYFLLKLVANISSKKISITLLSLALVKLKGFSIFQLIGLFRLIQTLRRSGRFSFNQNQDIKNSSKISREEAYKILNLDIKKNITKNDVKNAYIKIQKKIHPDISPETARLSMIVNEAKEIVLRDIS